MMHDADADADDGCDISDDDGGGGDDDSSNEITVSLATNSSMREK